LINRLQFLREQNAQAHHQSVSITRANVCEIIAAKCLRRRDQEHPGRAGLLNLASVLVVGFEPFQNAPEEVLKSLRSRWAGGKRTGYEKQLTALEVAIISESKQFLVSSASQKVVDAVHRGRIVYTPTSFMDIIPDRYKHKPVALYDPRKSPILNQYRLIVPRTRTVMDLFQFVLLFVLYALAMTHRNHTTFTGYEVMFIIYAFGWALDEFASILEHGINVHTQNLWAFLDLTFLFLYVVYFIVRMHGLVTGSLSTARQALDIISVAAPVVLPRLAFSIMPENMLFISLRAMMKHFTSLTLLAIWCFAGFFLALQWLLIESDTDDLDASNPITIGKWMLYIWFGLDGEGIQRSTDFHVAFGPILMITYAFLGNTLFLTILVSMLSHTFSKLVEDSTAEIQFRRAVSTFENVKADAIFAYQPPFNILALAILVPLRWIVSPRWFHKIHVAAVRLLNAPLLLVINLYERKYLWKQSKKMGPAGPSKRSSKAGFFSWSRFSAHGDCQAVFDVEPPQHFVDFIEQQLQEEDDEEPWGGATESENSPLLDGFRRRSRRRSSNSQNRPTGRRNSIFG
jgi:hypothetical protein